MEWNNQQWDKQYSAGEWSYLWDRGQAPRYAVLSTWLMHIRARSILDLGCGEGVLLQYLNQSLIERYHGVDFACAAIDRARTRWSDLGAATFECLDVEALDIGGIAGCDAVVLNEVLYSLADPVRFVHRLLRSGGPRQSLLVSVTTIHDHVADILQAAFAPVVREAVRCENMLGGRGWRMLLLREDTDT